MILNEENIKINETAKGILKYFGIDEKRKLELISDLIKYIDETEYSSDIVMRIWDKPEYSDAECIFLFFVLFDGVNGRNYARRNR